MQAPSELETLASSRATPRPKQTVVVVESNPDRTIAHRLNEKAMLMAALAGAALSASGTADALNQFGRATRNLEPWGYRSGHPWYRIGPPRVRPMTTKQRKKRLAKIARRSRQANRRRER